jgi:hypothetical protein
MSIANQKLNAAAGPSQGIRASDGAAPGPEAISPWEMVLLNEDRIPRGSIVLVPGEWVMQ